MMNDTDLDLTIAPLWLQEKILYENNIKKRKKVFEPGCYYVDYSRSSFISIQNIILENLKNYGPFKFKFKRNKKIYILLSHEDAVAFAEYSGYKKIKSRAYEDYIDTNCYNKETGEWSGWETK